MYNTLFDSIGLPFGILTLVTYSHVRRKISSKIGLIVYRSNLDNCFEAFLMNIFFRLIEDGVSSNKD